jgi:hypothetical protein
MFTEETPIPAMMETVHTLHHRYFLVQVLDTLVLNLV